MPSGSFEADTAVRSLSKCPEDTVITSTDLFFSVHREGALVHERVEVASALGTENLSKNMVFFDPSPVMNFWLCIILIQ